MTPTRIVAAILLVTLTSVGCTTGGDPAPAPTVTPTVAPSPTPDPEVEALGDRVGELHATVAALRTALEEAEAGDREALARAGMLLAADFDPRATDDERPAEAPLLPGPDSSRLETVAYGDLLTRLLAAARSAGSAGEPVARFLADPLAGDLGAWQRGPADLLAVITLAGEVRDLDAATDEILMLDGDAPRALAWVVHGTRHPDDAADAAGRALAHLAVIELALENLS